MEKEVDDSNVVEATRFRFLLFCFLLLVSCFLQPVFVLVSFFCFWFLGLFETVEKEVDDSNVVEATRFGFLSGFLLLVFLFVGVGVETHVENSNVVKTTRCFVKNLSRFGFFVSWCFLKRGC